MEIKPLSATLGAEITGISLTRDLDDALVTEIVRLLYQHAVVCIRNQPLEPSELQKFGSCLGTPIEHVEENLRLQDSPAVMSLSNADDRDDRQLNGGAHWHTDLIHTHEPASFTMLHAIAVPESGGGSFASGFFWQGKPHHAPGFGSWLACKKRHAFQDATKWKALVHWQENNSIDEFTGIWN